MPELSITADPLILIEDEGTTTTITISSNEPLPEGGLTVLIETGKPFALGDFNAFQASFSGGVLIRGLLDNSGLEFRLTNQTATITLPVFDDPDRTADGAVTDPSGPLRNDDQGEEQTTISIGSGEGYTVSPTAGSITLTFFDTAPPASTPTPAPTPTPDPISTPAPTPTPDSTPELSISADILTLLENEGTETTFTITSSEPLPEGGLVISLETNKLGALDDFVGFTTSSQLSTTGGAVIEVAQDGSDFTFRLDSQTATIRLPIDNDNDTGKEQTTFSIATGDGYTVSQTSGAVTLTLLDINPPTNGADRIRGSDTADTISGNGGRDILIGLAGDDTITGGAGRDSVRGGRGKDSLFGNGGNDKIFGGQGNDTMFGGGGSDIIVGNRGRDTFVLEQKSGRDTFRDFTDSQDRLGLSDGLEFDDLSFIDRGKNVLIRSGNNALALVRGINADQLTEADFVDVESPI
ncbi:MAG: calcium-binding protein [Cyanobacteria bacterium P01_F01_bin.150]